MKIKWSFCKLNRFIANPLELLFFTSCILCPGEAKTDEYIKYNLVYDLPDVLILGAMEKLGET